MHRDCHADPNGSICDEAPPGPASIACYLALLLLLLGAAVASDADANTWSSQRHSVRNTSFSTGTGAIIKPAIHWRMFLGGAIGSVRALDADLDDQDDVMVVEAGSAAVRTVSGKLLWKTPPLGIGGCSHVGDVDNDGIDELLCTTADSIALLNTTTGVVQWQPPPESARFVAFLDMADYDGDGIQDVAFGNAGSNGQPLGGKVMVYGFVGKPKLIAETADVDPVAGKVFSFDTRSVDIDGDGLPDLLTALQHEEKTGRIVAWSGKTGAVLGRTPPLSKARCDRVFALPKPTGKPLILCVANSAVPGHLNGLRGVTAFALQGDVLEIAYQRLLPDTVADRFIIPTHGVGDLDGDGLPEYVASVWSGGSWSLQAFDALSGKKLHTLDAGASGGVRVGRIWSQGGDVVLSGTVSKSVNFNPSDGRVLYKWSRKSGFSLWADASGRDVSPLRVVAQTPSAGSPSTWPKPPIAADLGGSTVAPVGVAKLDTDGDGFKDTIELVALGTPKLTSLSKRTFKVAPTGTSTIRFGATRAILQLLEDGAAHVLNTKLITLNDTNDDGVPDLGHSGQPNPYLVIGQGSGPGQNPLVGISAQNRVRIVDASLAGPFNEPEVHFDRRFTGSGRANFADLDSDGELEWAVRHSAPDGKSKLTAFESNGSVMWSYTHDYSSARWAFWTDGEAWGTADIDGDGAEDVVASFSSNVSPAEPGALLRVLSGKTGKSLWPATAPCATGMAGRPFALDTTGATVTGISSIYLTRWRCNLATGAIEQNIVRPKFSYGVPMLVDIDGKPPLDAAWLGSAYGVGVDTTAEHTPLWRFATKDVNAQDAVLIEDSAANVLVTARSIDTQLQAFDAATGKPLWQRSYSDGNALAKGEAAPTGVLLLGLIGVKNLTGNATSSLIFHTTEGRIYAVSAVDGAVWWSLPFGGALSDPVVGDVDGDGLVEILFATPDGYLNAIAEDTLGAVDWVRENDGTGPALTDAQDLDEQEQSDALALNWAALDGADGYSVRLVDDSGAGVVPLTQVGNVTSTVIDNLHLQAGRTYTAFVLPYRNAGAAKSYGGAKASDGLKIVDKSGPSMTGFAVQPALLDDAHVAATFVATVSDKTRLAGVQLEIFDTTGKRIYFWRRPLATSKYDVSHVWSATSPDGKPLPAGVYKATLRAEDGQKFFVAATTEVRMCLPGGRAVDGKCVFKPLVSRAPDGPQIGVGQGGEGADQSTCQCDVRRTNSTVPIGALALAVACLLALMIARREDG